MSHAQDILAAGAQGLAERQARFEAEKAAHQKAFRDDKATRQALMTLWQRLKPSVDEEMDAYTRAMCGGIIPPSICAYPRITCIAYVPQDRSAADTSLTMSGQVQGLAELAEYSTCAVRYDPDRETYSVDGWLVRTRRGGAYYEERQGARQGLSLEEAVEATLAVWLEAVKAAAYRAGGGK